MKNGKKTLFIVAVNGVRTAGKNFLKFKKFYNANKDKVNVIVVFTNNNTNLGETQTYVRITNTLSRLIMMKMVQLLVDLQLMDFHLT